MRLGITRQRLALVENSIGSYCVLTNESGEMPLALAAIISSECTFEREYCECSQEIHGIPLNSFKFSSIIRPLRSYQFS